MAPFFCLSIVRRARYKNYCLLVLLVGVCKGRFKSDPARVG